MGASEQLDDVFEIARGVLENLLELMEVSASVKFSPEFSDEDEQGAPSSIGLNIEGNDLGILIGHRGQTMAALQHIVRLIMSHKIQAKMPIVIDVEDYKRRRCEGLRNLASRLAEQVTARSIPFSMEPMCAFDRRIIHLALANHPEVTTESTGLGEGRKVVILPRRV